MDRVAPAALVLYPGGFEPALYAHEVYRIKFAAICNLVADGRKR